MIEILLPYIITVGAVCICLLGIFIKPKRKRGSVSEDLTLVIPIANTIYKVSGHFSKKSKMTAKDKVTRIIKKEITKKQ